MTAAIVGAIMTSFAGVIADRLPRQLGLTGEADPDVSLSHPSSHCDSCQHPLGLVELIPIVGWLATGGHCRHCGSPVPKKYPVMEASVAVASAAAVAFLPGWEALAICFCLWFLVAVSWLDWTAQEIPDFFTVPLFFIGLLASPFDPDTASRALGAAVCGGFVWTSFKLTGSSMKVDAMSYGDVALAAALGAWVGTCGALPFIVAGAVFYIAYALPLRNRGMVWVPMGPGLSAGFLLVAATGIGT